MAAFGFSIGDVIAGLRILYVSCESLKDASSARQEYTALRTEIQSLLVALEAIEDLGWEITPSSTTATGAESPSQEHRTVEKTDKQKAAICAAVSSCKGCIEEFLTRAAKYEPHLLRESRHGVTTTTSIAAGGSRDAWIAGYRKIKWAVCKREDVTRFRAQLERHASSINMLLITFQAQNQMLTSTKRHEPTADMQLATCPTSRKPDDNITELLNGLTLEQRQCFQLLITQNQQLQQSLDDIRQLLRVQSLIPPQVMLQSPVVLLDAFGKTAPFHLDFIDSIDAFVAVLKIRSEQAGVRSRGLRKLDKREFCIRDTQRRRNIDLDRPWNRVFRPGQQVDMSMVFRRRVTPTLCPECGCENAPCEEDGEIECDFCGLWYHHAKNEIIEEEEPAPGDFTSNQHILSHNRSNVDADKNFAGYRRVRIIAMMLKPPPISPPPAYSEHALFEKTEPITHPLPDTNDAPGHDGITTQPIQVPNRETNRTSSSSPSLKNPNNKPAPRPRPHPRPSAARPPAATASKQPSSTPSSTSPRPPPPMFQCTFPACDSLHSSISSLRAHARAVHVPAKTSADPAATARQGGGGGTAIEGEHGREKVRVRTGRTGREQIQWTLIDSVMR